MSGRRTDQHQCYMDFAPLILYMVTMIIRQARCHSPCSLESVSELKGLMSGLTGKEMYDCKLYTPTLNDYENCSKSMLECFEKEANVLFTENEVRRSNKLIRILKKLAQQLQDKRLSCPACEVYREEKAETFLQALLATLQTMNTKNC